MKPTTETSSASGSSASAGVGPTGWFILPWLLTSCMASKTNERCVSGLPSSDFDLPGLVSFFKKN